MLEPRAAFPGCVEVVGPFRSRFGGSGVYTYWKETGAIDPPVLEGLDSAVAAMEEAASLLDARLEQKQANLTEVAAVQAVETGIAAWDQARQEIVRLNALLEAYTGRIKELKESVDASALPGLERELKSLQASKQRHEADTPALIRRLEEHQEKKTIAKEKTAAKQQLSDHGRAITASLGKTINAYLARLNAGFRIDYKESNYQGQGASGELPDSHQRCPRFPAQHVRYAHAAQLSQYAERG